MAPYNVVQRERREQTQQRKRQLHGEPGTRKLKQRSNPIAISGKRKRKLFKKWRREQKDAIGKGLITMGDVEMAVAEGTSQEPSDDKSPIKFHLKKKGSKLKIKKLKSKDKSKKKSAQSPGAEGSTDVMVE